MKITAELEKDSGQAKRFWKTYPASSIDYFLVIMILVLTIIGCFFIYDLTFAYFEVYFYRQLVFAIFGVAVMLVISMINYYEIIALAPALYFVAFIFMLLQINCKPSLRFMRIGPIVIFTPQLLLLFSCLYLVKLLSSPENKNIILLSFVISISSALLLAVLDLPSAVVHMIISYSLLFMKWPKCAITASLISGAVLVLIILSTNVYLERIRTWIYPSSINGGWSTLWSYYAIAAGDFFGVGIGQGCAKNILPRIESHYILTGITEEVGVIGATLILLLFGLLILRMFFIALRCSDKLGFYFTCFVMIRMMIILFLQVCVITGTLPVIGVCVPFFSYNGTAMIFDFLLMGILLSVSKSIRMKAVR